MENRAKNPIKSKKTTTLISDLYEIVEELSLRHKRLKKLDGVSTKLRRILARLDALKGKSTNKSDKKPKDKPNRSSEISARVAILEEICASGMISPDFQDEMKDRLNKLRRKSLSNAD